ncbi:calcium-binding protein [Vibrio sp. STUT-A11]|uniref:calcium-binding protein n=1 Tax=unclassified Vibrio TaxID=2614977 RepID=UPI00222F568B|nr:calcium-binding protein [Vibrio sp. STUT-A11]BDR15718.1 calcium-binding protein [Vibrio sp. STUT-A11]
MTDYYGTPEADVISDFEGGDDLFVGYDGDDVFVGGGGDDLLIGGAGNDHLVGGAGNDVIRGGTGDDYLAGGHGDDILYGLQGDNTLNGSTGNDVLVAGSGNNFMVGGEGDDVFVFTDNYDGHGEAKVADFTIGEDLIRINSCSVNDFSDLCFSYDNAGNAIFTDGADLTVKLVGITETDITTHGADLFVF